MRFPFRAWGVFLSLTLALPSCGGSTPTALSPGTHPESNSGRIVSAKMTVTMPLPEARGSAQSRRPQYLPLATQSLEVTLLDVNGVPPSPVPAPAILNVASSVPACTIANGDYACPVTVALPAGRDTLLVQSFDAANAAGNVLSQLQPTFTVVQNGANNFSMTLDANPGAIAVTPSAGSSCSGSPIVNCTFPTFGAAQSFVVTVADTHGTQLANNTIPGSPVLSATSSNRVAAIVSAAQDPYGITLAPGALGTSTITVTASPATKNSGLSARTFTFTATVEQPSLTAPYGVAVDASGNVYVANLGTLGHGFVTEYAAGGGGSILAITNAKHLPFAVAVDASGNIYVAYDNNTVTKYDAQGKPTLTISSGVSAPRGVAVDAAGNIYASNYGLNTVTKYAPSGGTPILTIDSKVSLPWGVALDAAGNIYVANNGSARLNKYPPTGGSPTLSIRLHGPDAALDASGNIYMANSLRNTVTKYAPNGDALLTISTGLDQPAGVAVDARGNIYVTNVLSNTVTEYAPTGGNPILTLY